MPTITADTGRDPALAQQLEAQFTNHNVKAYKIRDRYGEDSTAADWGVVCADCGRAHDFFLTSNEGEVDISDVFIESLEDEPCEPYEIPDDVSTGDHTLVVHDEDPEKTGWRIAHCRDCGRTTRATSKPEYAGNYIDKLATLPCIDRFTNQELSSAVLYQSIPSFPDKTEVGIENWQYEGGTNGWGSNVDAYWWHPEVPVTIVRNSDRVGRYIQFNLVPGRLNKGSGSRPPGGIRTATLGKFKYQERERYGDDPDPYHDKVLDVLAFMQATNDFNDGDFTDIHEHTTSPTLDVIVDAHILIDSTPTP